MLEEMKSLATRNSLQQQLMDIQSKGEEQEIPSKPSRIAANFSHALMQRETESQPSNLIATKAAVASSKPTTTTTTTTNPPPKPNKFVKDMEERARLRVERKAELGRLKEQKQREKIEAQRKKEEEERSREEEEKRRKMEEIRERRRIEREEEIERERRASEARSKLEAATEHDRRRLLKWYEYDIFQRK